MPTKAPGRVTSPTVRVWSRPGTRASAVSSRAISSAASRGMNPTANAASYSPCRLRSASSARRPASTVAVIAPPIKIPPIGTRAVPAIGTSPLATSSTTTGTDPASTGTAAQMPLRLRVSRRPAVALATVDMNAKKANVSGSEPSTAAMTSATASSWTTARPLARTTAHAWPRPPVTLTSAASAVVPMTTSTRATRADVDPTVTSASASRRALTARPAAPAPGPARLRGQDRGLGWWPRTASPPAALARPLGRRGR